MYLREHVANYEQPPYIMVTDTLQKSKKLSCETTFTALDLFE